MAVGFLKARRQEAKSFLSGVCEGIALAKQNRPKALEIMTQLERGRDPAALEYLYRLYTTEVIPDKPYPKFEGVELGIQMVASTVPSARGIKTQELIDASLMEKLVREAAAIDPFRYALLAVNQCSHDLLAHSVIGYFCGAAGGPAGGGMLGVGTTMPGPSGISSTSVTRVT
jgi:hypothetical protein